MRVADFLVEPHMATAHPVVPLPALRLVYEVRLSRMNAFDDVFDVGRHVGPLSLDTR